MPASPRPSFLVALLCACALGAPAAAAADSSTTIAILRDCQDGALAGTYTVSQLTTALRSIPTDADEYSDCADVIRDARLAAAGGKGGGGTTGGGSSGTADGGPSPSTQRAIASGPGVVDAQKLLAAASPQERAQVAAAIARGASTPVSLGGVLVRPDASGLSPSGDANSLPTPLVIAALALAAAGGAGLALGLRAHVLGRRAASA